MQLKIDQCLRHGVPVFATDGCIALQGDSIEQILWKLPARITVIAGNALKHLFIPGP
jgi:hypothetical protein